MQICVTRQSFPFPSRCDRTKASRDSGFSDYTRLQLKETLRERTTIRIKTIQVFERRVRYPLHYIIVRFSGHKRLNKKIIYSS